MKKEPEKSRSIKSWEEIAEKYNFGSSINYLGLSLIIHHMPEPFLCCEHWVIAGVVTCHYLCNGEIKSIDFQLEKFANIALANEMSKQRKGTR